MSEWVVEYRPSGRGAEPVTWLRLVGVPAQVKRAEVLESLEGWGEWQRRYGRAMAPGSRTVVRRPRAGEVSAADKWDWSSVRPVTRRVTVELPGEVHASLTRLARARGESLEALAAATLTTRCQV